MLATVHYAYAAWTVGTFGVVAIVGDRIARRGKFRAPLRARQVDLLAERDRRRAS